MVDGSLNTKVTSVSHNFVAADVGTRLQITNAAGGAWTAGFYTILSVAANAATLNSSPAAISSTGGVWAEMGLEYSNQNSPQVAIDNSTITTSIAANVITFTGYTPSAKDIGNNVHMLTGTNVTAGWYQVTAFTASTWTVTGAVNLPTSGTTTNATGNMGGALLTLSNATGLAGAMVASNKAFCTGAFTATTATAISFAQTVVPTPTAPVTTVIGYGSTRGDGIHATLALSTNTGQTGLTATGSGFSLLNFDVDCGSLGTSTGLVGSGNYTLFWHCKAANFTSKGISLTGNDAKIAACEITGGTAAASSAVLLVSAGQTLTECFIHDNACVGVITNNVAAINSNLIVNNSGANSDGIQPSHGCLILNNTVHNNGRDGINMTSGNPTVDRFLGNILSSNGRFGINFSGGAIGALPDLDGNAYFSNTSGTRASMDSVAGIYGVNPFVNTHDVILSVSPYIGPTTGSTANFALNNAAGGGAACRGAGSPKTWAGNTGTTGSPDLGAVQSAGKGGAGIIFAV